MMRQFVRIASIAVAMVGVAFLAACTAEERAANEQKARDILAAVKAGAAIAVSTVKEGVDALCANQSVINATGGVANSVFQTQTGPNSTQNQQNVQLALATLNNVCARAAANPNDPAMKQLLSQAMAAYQTVKAAQASQ